MNKKKRYSPSPTVVNPVLKSPLRKTLKLDGIWDFAIDPGEGGELQEWFKVDVDLPDRIPLEVPGCWESQGIGGPGRNLSKVPESIRMQITGSYKGIGWFKKSVQIPDDWADHQIWLKIGGVHPQGWFWVNGIFINHDFCYCGTYKYNVTDLVQPGQTAVITIKIQNTVPSGKGLFASYHRFGGIFRSVELEITPDVLIDYAYVEGDYDKKRVKVFTIIRSVKSMKQDIPFSSKVELGLEAEISPLEPSNGSTTSFNKAGITFRIDENDSQTFNKTLEIDLSPFLSWSPENPNLYQAVIKLKKNGHVIDEWIERFGVKKWEVRGSQFYLNNQPFFVRGAGDDFVYPLTIFSPPSRELHKQHLKLLKEFGFNYIRLHTHVEIPEYFEVADEVGLMIQPELPYYGDRPSALRIKRNIWFRPKEDLIELVTHYQRYVSLATYCFGNEGHFGSPMDKEIYLLAKELDPLRLVLHQDGGKNRPENSDFGTGPNKPWTDGIDLDNLLGHLNIELTPDKTRPWFCHEYLNLAVHQDPRLESQYQGVILPKVTMNKFKEQTDHAGISLEWGLKCIDAGQELQKIYQKRGIEAARLDPDCSGYIYWTIVNVLFFGDQGLLDPFWKLKKSSPSFFRDFNSLSSILARFSPNNSIFSEGDQLKIEWWLSYFHLKTLNNVFLNWTLDNQGKELISGKIEGITVKTGDIKSLGDTNLQIPKIDYPMKTKMIVSVEADGFSIQNTWDLWLFPKLESSHRNERDIIIITECLFPEGIQALEQGKTVFLIGFSDIKNCIKPGVEPGWWSINEQTGTVIANHPAFGKFPHEGFINELMFRLNRDALKLPLESLKSVDPIILGSGLSGYHLIMFEAKVGQGRLFASGLNLLSENPEAIYLLNEFNTYLQSDQFEPINEISLDNIKKWRLEK